MERSREYGEGSGKARTSIVPCQRRGDYSPLHQCRERDHTAPQTSKEQGNAARGGGGDPVSTGGFWRSCLQGNSQGVTPGVVPLQRSADPRSNLPGDAQPRDRRTPLPFGTEIPKFKHLLGLPRFLRNSVKRCPWGNRAGNTFSLLPDSRFNRAPPP